MLRLSVTVLSTLDVLDCSRGLNIHYLFQFVILDTLYEGFSSFRFRINFGFVAVLFGVLLKVRGPFWVWVDFGSSLVLAPIYGGCVTRQSFGNRRGVARRVEFNFVHIQNIPASFSAWDVLLLVVCWWTGFYLVQYGCLVDSIYRSLRVVLCGLLRYCWICLELFSDVCEGRLWRFGGRLCSVGFMIDTPGFDGIFQQGQWWVL